jgi:hypothetical protein
MASYALYKDEPLKIRIKKVRASYPHVYEVYKGKSDDDGNGASKGKYCISCILDQKGEHKDTVAKLVEMMIEAAKEKWGEKDGEIVYDGLKSDGRVLLRNGNSKVKGTNESSDNAHRGKLVFTANNAIKPSVFDRARVNGKAVKLNKEDGKPYAGCYINVIITVWAQDNQWGRRVNAELNGVQFWEDGERITAGSPPSESAEFDFDEAEAVNEGALEEDEFDEAFA